MLSVIFATYNGADTLPTMLDAFTHLEQPIEWEVIAIDNASSDATSEILASYQTRLPLQIIYESRRGKNYALNRGLQNVRGDLVVFTDDDVIPEPDWLTCLLACAESRSDFDIFGGRILPHWNATPDPVVLRNAPLGITYGITPSRQETGPIFPGLIWGANMAVRKRVFDAGHRFNEGVGPNGRNYIMGSETEFNIRAAREGHKAWFCNTARIAHIIRVDQLQPSWVLGRAYRFGRSQWIQESTSGFDVPCIGGIPRWRFAAIAKEYARWISATIRLDKDTRFKADWEIHFLRGYLSQAVQSRRAVGPEA